MNLHQTLAVLSGRKNVLLLWLAVSLVAALVLSQVLPKRYTAQASVLVDLRSPDPVAGMVLPTTPSYMVTQQDIISSERVANLVIRNLGLNENTALKKRWLRETGGRGEFLAWLAQLLQKELKVKPTKESNIIDISYSAPDPVYAADAANAFVRAYVTTAAELRTEPARQYNALFAVQAKRLRQELENAQNRLAESQKVMGIIDVDQRYDVENNRLNELSSQLVAAEGQSSDAMSRQRQAGSDSPEVVGNFAIASLKTELARQDARVRELAARLGESNPMLVEARASADELRRRIDTEVSHVANSLGVSSNVTSAREAQLRQDLSRQRLKVLQLKEYRDQAYVLSKDVDNAQRAYDEVRTRLSQTHLEMQTAQTNVSILKNASIPPDASFPKVRMFILLGLLAGLVMGVSSTVVLEFFDRRLRLIDDLAGSMDAPLALNLPRMQLHSSKQDSPANDSLFHGHAAAEVKALPQ